MDWVATPIRTTRKAGQWVTSGPSADRSGDDGGSTGTLESSSRRGFFITHLLPLSIAATVAAGPRSGVFRGVMSAGAETPIQVIMMEHAEESWEPVPMLITNDQVRALNALLALPYTSDHGFEYFADD